MTADPPSIRIDPRGELIGGQIVAVQVHGYPPDRVVPVTVTSNAVDFVLKELQIGTRQPHQISALPFVIPENCTSVIFTAPGAHTVIVAVRQATDPDDPALICASSVIAEFVGGAKEGRADFLVV